MGLDTDLFVGPVSEHLLCPICQDVLVNPVETPCQHLFCESELLEFYSKTGRTTCPVDNMPLDPTQIKKPGRIILSLLGELQRYCTYKREGCTWVGQQSSLGSHLSTCCFNRDLLSERDDRIARLEQLLREKENIIDAVHDKLAVCKQENRYLREKLRVVEELLDPLYLNEVLRHKGGGGSQEGGGSRRAAAEEGSSEGSSGGDDGGHDDDDDDESRQPSAREEEDAAADGDDDEEDEEGGVQKRGGVHGGGGDEKEKEEDDDEEDRHVCCPGREGSRGHDERPSSHDEKEEKGVGRSATMARMVRATRAAPTDLEEIARLRASLMRVEIKGVVDNTMMSSGSSSRSSTHHHPQVTL